MKLFINFTDLIGLLAIALVLVPTRELCLQVHEILQKLLHRFHWIVPGYIMGGESRSKEKARLRKGRNHVYSSSDCLFQICSLLVVQKLNQECCVKLEMKL